MKDKDKASTSNQKNRIAKNEFFQKWNRERDKAREGEKGKGKS